MKTQMIINADDFGFCDGVNDAICKANTEGVLTSATLMTNMDAAAEAVKMSKSLPRLGVGVHLNILEGKPLSAADAVKILLNKDGQFKYSPAKLAIKSMVCGRTRKAIEIELTSQVQWAFDNGIVPTHLDSHKHFHCFGTIYKIVCRIAEKFEIGAIRWPWEPATVCGKDWPKVAKKDKKRAFMVRTMAKKCQKIDDRFIKNDIFFGLAHTGRIDEHFWDEISKTQFAGIAEVMTHPGYADRIDPATTRLIAQRQMEMKWLCAESTKEKLAAAEIELIHYGNIKKVKDRN